MVFWRATGTRPKGLLRQSFLGASSCESFGSTTPCRSFAALAGLRSLKVNQNKTTNFRWWFYFGGATGTQTLDLFHAMEALYQLSYSPVKEQGTV